MVIFGSSKNLEVTQAVLICDNFNEEFQPVQSDQQLALLKIANCPIIEYTLTFLKTNGIEQVIIFSSNAEKLRNYLEERKWIKEGDEIPFAIVLASDNLTSLGDVMRDVYNSNLIKKDFVLLNGNVIGGSVPLLKYMKEHIDRRQISDKGSVITIVYMKLDSDHRSRSKENDSILVVNRDTQKMLAYETLSGNPKRKIDLGLELFQKNPNLKIHFDLQDTNIAICSTAVPQLFVDNFDYNTKDDFIHGLLVHEDILENTIYTKIIDEGSYGIKVYDAFSFDAVSRDIVGRWSFPMVPDLQDDDLCYHRHNIYKSSSVDLKIDSVLEQNLVIGKNTTIDSGAQIKESVIGENCKIGKNVRLDGCYLMDNVVIESDCTLNQCIVSNNVLIKKNCQVKEGCIVGANCILGPDIWLEQCLLLQAKSTPGGDEKIDPKLVGKEGRGYLFKFEEDDEDEPDEEPHRRRIQWGQQVKVDDLTDDGPSSDDESEAPVDEMDNDLEEDDDDYDDEFDYEFRKFYDEVIDSLNRGLEEKIECKNLILEINCSKHAYNIPIKDLVCLVIKAILDLPKYMDKSLSDERQYYAKFQSVLKHCLLLFKNYVKSPESQQDCLLTLENYTLTNSALFGVSNFVRVLTVLYDKEILSEESILEWSRSTLAFPATLNQVDAAERKKLRSNEKLNKFIIWLNEAEEESSEYDDE